MASGLLNERQTAAYLGVSPRCLAAWRHRGGGPHFLRIGYRTVRYLPADVEEWLSKRRFASTAEEGEGANRVAHDGTGVGA